MSVESQQLLGMWLKAREIQNQSKLTLLAYERDVGDFLQFCDQKKLLLQEIIR